MKRTITALAMVLLLAVAAFAHGNDQHVMGKVTQISGNSITVETTAKKSVSVEVSDQTKFDKSGSAAALTDLKVGDKVVIHAAKEGDKLVAHQVRFGTMKSGKGMDHMKGMEGMDHSQPDTQPQH